LLRYRQSRWVRLPVDACSICHKYGGRETERDEILKAVGDSAYHIIDYK
jgi:hypothetical protein